MSKSKEFKQDVDWLQRQRDKQFKREKDYLQRQRDKAVGDFLNTEVTLRYGAVRVEDSRHVWKEDEGPKLVYKPDVVYTDKCVVFTDKYIVRYEDEDVNTTDSPEQALKEYHSLFKEYRTKNPLLPDF